MKTISVSELIKNTKQAFGREEIIVVTQNGDPVNMIFPLGQAGRVIDNSPTLSKEDDASIKRGLSQSKSGNVKPFNKSFVRDFLIKQEWHIA